eukprot:jgi/Mesvir1/1896/Mv22926-RA.1
MGGRACSRAKTHEHANSCTNMADKAKSEHLSQAMALDAMITADDYVRIREQLNALTHTPTPPVSPPGAMDAGSNTKRGVPFQLPSVIRPKKRTKRGDIKDTACSAFRPYPQDTPLVARSLFTTPGKAHLESSWTSKMGVFEKETLPDSQPEPLSDSLVDTPELGEYSKMTWREFGNVLNRMDCNVLGRFSSKSEHHAVAVSLAMGLQGIEYCFAGCQWCHTSPRATRPSGLAS